MCSSLVLLPNSINILPYTPVKSASEPVPVPHPLATHRITLNIQYADTTFSVLVTMEHSLDFLVTSPLLLLPMKYLDDKPFPPNYPNTSLVELVRWLISQLKNSMRHRILVEEKLSGLASAVENLVNMNIITEDSYEVVIVGVMKEMELSDKTTQFKPDMEDSEVIKRVMEIISNIAEIE